MAGNNGPNMIDIARLLHVQTDLLTRLTEVSERREANFELVVTQLGNQIVAIQQRSNANLADIISVRDRLTTHDLTLANLTGIITALQQLIANL